MKYPFPPLQFPSTDALQDIEGLREAAGEIYQWIMTYVVGNDVFPRKCPVDIADSLGRIHQNSERLESKIRAIQEAENNVVIEILRKAQKKEPLTPTEYYYLRSLDLISGVDEENSEYNQYRLAFESKNTTVSTVSDDLKT